MIKKKLQERVRIYKATPGLGTVGQSVKFLDHLETHGKLCVKCPELHCHPWEQDDMPALLRPGIHLCPHKMHSGQFRALEYSGSSSQTPEPGKEDEKKKK